MGHDLTAPKRATNLSLNEDLVRRASNVSPNLSETVERLLAEHVDRQDAAKAAPIAAHNAFVNAHGLVGTEFDPEFDVHPNPGGISAAWR